MAKATCNFAVSHRAVIGSFWSSLLEEKKHLPFSGAHCTAALSKLFYYAESKCLFVSGSTWTRP